MNRKKEEEEQRKKKEAIDHGESIRVDLILNSNPYLGQTRQKNARRRY